MQTPRFPVPHIEEAPADTPVVLISGPRQSGKTTQEWQLTADRFTAGIVLYDGDTTLPFGPKLWAVPLGTLWRTRFR